MSRLLYLTAVLVSIACCSLLSSATAGDTKYMQLSNEETLALAQSRTIREAGKGEKKNKKNGGKRRIKGKRGPKGKKSRESKQRKQRKQKKERKERKVKKEINLKIEQKRQRQQKKVIKKRRNKNNDKTFKKSKTKKEKQGRKKVKQNIYFNTKATTCPEKLNDYVEISYQQYRTMERVGKRLLRNHKAMVKRHSLRFSFRIPHGYLLRGLGGNSVGLKCGNRLPHWVDLRHYQILDNCGTTLSIACSPVLASDKVKIEDCSTTKFQNFRKSVLDVLTSKTVELDICNEVNAQYATKDIADIQKCNTDLIGIEKTHKSTIETCTREYKRCLRSEKAVAEILDRCKINNPTLVILRVIYAVWINLVFIFPSYIFILPWWPNGRRALNKRHKRQVAEDPRCQEILDAWKSFNASAIAAANTVDESLNETAAEQALLALEFISNRTDLEGDINTCRNETGQSVFASEQIKSYYEGAEIWMEEVVKPKIENIPVTPEMYGCSSSTSTTPEVANSTSDSFSTPTVANSTTDTSSTPTVTTVSPGRRAKFHMEVKKNFKHWTLD